MRATPAQRGSFQEDGAKSTRSSFRHLVVRRTFSQGADQRQFDRLWSPSWLSSSRQRSTPPSKENRFNFFSALVSSHSGSDERAAHSGETTNSVRRSCNSRYASIASQERSATQSRLCRDVGRCANRLPCSRLTMDPPFGSPLSLKPHPRVPACYGTPRHDAHVPLVACFRRVNCQTVRSCDCWTDCSGAGCWLLGGLLVAVCCSVCYLWTVDDFGDCFALTEGRQTEDG